MICDYGISCSYSPVFLYMANRILEIEYDRLKVKSKLRLLCDFFKHYMEVGSAHFYLPFVFGKPINEHFCKQ